MSKYPAAGQGLKWTKCPAVRHFHRFLAEKCYNLSRLSVLTILKIVVVPDDFPTVRNKRTFTRRHDSYKTIKRRPCWYFRGNILEYIQYIQYTTVQNTFRHCCVSLSCKEHSQLAHKVMRITCNFIANLHTIETLSILFLIRYDKNNIIG